ncbi:MAG: hypothetical protein K1X35_13650 [Caulobacteraceae bacterium]|nr:hypothetical protein [Caulobacteraceae bacterium]
MTTRRNFLGLAAGGGALAGALPLTAAAAAAAPATLWDGVAAACRRLAPHGWRELILKASRGAIDLKASGLKGALDRRLKVDRTVAGFDDFGGGRGVEPGAPGLSLLYHAFASPRVAGEALTAYPTPAEIEAVENYVYGVRAPTLEQLRAKAGDGTLAVVTFALEYRPARDAVHGDVADLCFTRTGIARMGDLEPAYNGAVRGWEPIDPARPFSFRTIPARFAPYLAVRRKADSPAFGPQDPLANDGERYFWAPLHKLFSGRECIRGLDVSVELSAHYRNEKLRRFHRYLRNQGYFTEWAEDDLENFPFVIKDEMIASLSRDAAHGSGMVLPRPALFVNRARYRDQWLSFEVPGDWASTPGVLYFSSGQILAGSDEIPRIPEPPSPVAPGDAVLPDETAPEPHEEEDGDWAAYYADLAADTDRNAPEYISVRHRLMSDGTLQDLNLRPDMFEMIRKGGYRAQHFIDFSGGGWVQARTRGLPDEFRIGVPACSLISPPDFFPYVSQRDLTNWWKRETPEILRAGLWAIPPYPLSHRRMAGDINLPLGFNINDDTATAIVCHPRATVGAVRAQAPVRRTSSFPDNSPGVFDPGWDASQGIFYAADGQMLQRYLQNHGLGTPFVEDVKLCAALGSYWPAIAPDSTRTWTPLKKAPGELYPWPTIVPLTDMETGIEPGPGGRLMPWDGVNGPARVERDGKTWWRYRNIDRADYIAMPGTMTAALLGQVDLEETKARVMAMEAVYWALGIHDPDFVERFGGHGDRAAVEVLTAKAGWAVASFRAVAPDDPSLAAAERAAGGRLMGRTYAFRLYVPREEIPDPEDQQFVLVSADGDEVVAYAGGGRALVKRGGGAWIHDASMPA